MKPDGSFYIYFSGRHSDINLVELGNDTVKEDDRAVLLEGGGLQSSSPRVRSLTVTSHIARFVDCRSLWLLYCINRLS